jgi:hypothetical protein
MKPRSFVSDNTNGSQRFLLSGSLTEVRANSFKSWTIHHATNQLLLGSKECFGHSVLVLDLFQEEIPVDIARRHRQSRKLAGTGGMRSRLPADADRTLLYTSMLGSVANLALELLLDVWLSEK